MKVKGGHMWPVSHTVSNWGPTLRAKRLARGWREQRSSASLPGCQALLSVQSDSSAWVKPLFLRVPSPAWAMSPYHEKHCVHISPPARRRASVVRWHLPSDYNHRANGAECSSSFVFVCCCCSLTPPCLFFRLPKTNAQAKWACFTLFFTNFFREQSV